MTRISELLDDTLERSWILLGLLAWHSGRLMRFNRGMARRWSPRSRSGPQARLYQPVLLGLATTLTHMGSVLLIALALWLTGATQVETVHTGLTRVAGFVIAAAGFWRIGRYVGGYDEHEIVEHRTDGMSNLEVLGLGVAGGLVPCWDAVGLVVLAAALGRLARAWLWCSPSARAWPWCWSRSAGWRGSSRPGRLAWTVVEWQRRLGWLAGYALGDRLLSVLASMRADDAREGINLAKVARAGRLNRD